MDKARLRGERDLSDALHSEKKALLNTNFNALKEYKALAEAREVRALSIARAWTLTCAQERILSLRSEVTRLRTRLAAATGDEDLYTFLRVADAEGVPAYVADLKNRLQ